MRASVKTLVQKLESGGPDAGPPAQPHGSSQPHGPVSQRAECAAPGVHVTVLRGRDFAAHADVGSYVCLSTLSNDADVAELAIGALPCSPPAPARFSGCSGGGKQRRWCSCHSRPLCARCRSQHQQGEAAHLLLQGPGDSLHPAGIPHASSERVAAPHVRRVDSLQGGGMRSCNPPPFFSRSLPGADITSGAGQRRREAASPRPGHHPLNHRPQRPSDRRRQNDWKCTGVPLSWTPDAKVV